MSSERALFTLVGARVSSRASFPLPSSPFSQMLAKSALQSVGTARPVSGGGRGLDRGRRRGATPSPLASEGRRTRNQRPPARVGGPTITPSPSRCTRTPTMHVLGVQWRHGPGRRWCAQAALVCRPGLVPPFLPARALLRPLLPRISTSLTQHKPFFLPHSWRRPPRAPRPARVPRPSPRRVSFLFCGREKRDAAQSTPALAHALAPPHGSVCAMRSQEGVQ